jgi:hypothetical protein
MSDTRDPLAPFEDETIERVASTSRLSVAELRDLLERHQEQARDNPGVEDLVYEWRSQFHEPPLVHRTTEAYYLRLRRHVWEEFADALDIAEVDLDTMIEVHEQQVRLDTGAETRDGEHLMLLTRE